MLLGGKRDIKKVHPALSGLMSSPWTQWPGGTITLMDLQDLIVDAERRSSSSFNSGETPATGLAFLIVEYKHQRSKVLDYRLISALNSIITNNLHEIIYWNALRTLSVRMC